MSTNLAVGTTIAEEMLHAQMTYTIELPNGALVIENEVDRLMVKLHKVV